MSAWLMAVVAVIYAFTAYCLWMEGKPGLAVAFIGYVIGNLGLILAALQK